MNKENEPDQFNVLRKISSDPKITQRKLAVELALSLGKTNYCLKALKKKGLIKIQNFSKNKDRFNPVSKYNYFYILTPKGIKTKTKLTINFMKKKIKEYEELKKELK
jgi:EPS-associated MarR family transcriptional regulator